MAGGKKSGAGRGGRAPSEAQRENGRRRAAENNAVRHLRPKCGAKRRNGEPCQQTAMPSGRCYLHGGRTPRGDKWHTPQPTRDGPDAGERLERKLQDLARRRERQAARRAGMTAKEGAAHRAWQESHRPGNAKARAAHGARRRQDIEASLWLHSVMRGENDEGAKTTEAAPALMREAPAAAPLDAECPTDEVRAMQSHKAIFPAGHDHAEDDDHQPPRPYREAEEAIGVLVGMIRDAKTPPTARVQACGQILRAAGMFEKPDDGGSDVPPHLMTPAQLARATAAAAQRLEQIHRERAERARPVLEAKAELPAVAESQDQDGAGIFG